jgi:hypothetical protein
MPNLDWAGRPVLASIINRSSFLIGELLLGKLGETVVVHGNAPHDRSRSLVSHLIGNRASFLCTKAPMLRVPNKPSGSHSQSSRTGAACAVSRKGGTRRPRRDAPALAALTQK